VRRLLTWAVVTLGIAALARRLRRRRDSAPVEPVGTPPEDDPADELRRKLAESRAEEEAAAPPSTPPQQATVDERRAAVHDAGRSTLDEMREPDGT
jgi:hypothetical protein